MIGKKGERVDRALLQIFVGHMQREQSNVLQTLSSLEVTTFKDEVSCVAEMELAL